MFISAGHSVVAEGLANAFGVSEAPTVLNTIDEGGSPRPTHSNSTVASVGIDATASMLKTTNEISAFLFIEISKLDHRVRLRRHRTLHKEHAAGRAVRVPQAVAASPRKQPKVVSKPRSTRPPVAVVVVASVRCAWGAIPRKPVNAGQSTCSARQPASHHSQAKISPIFAELDTFTRFDDTSPMFEPADCRRVRE